MKEFTYDSESGLIKRKKIKRGVRDIENVGWLDKDGYLMICVSYVRLRSHCVAWFMHYGEWPECDLDHINGDRVDNRISNLRLATNRENQLNRESHRSGQMPGASFYKITGRWRSQIEVNGIKLHLGYFDTEKEASEKYLSYIKDNNIV